MLDFLTAGLALLMLIVLLPFAAALLVAWYIVIIPLMALTVTVLWVWSKFEGDRA